MKRALFSLLFGTTLLVTAMADDLTREQVVTLQAGLKKAKPTLVIRLDETLPRAHFYEIHKLTGHVFSNDYGKNRTIEIGGATRVRVLVLTAGSSRGSLTLTQGSERVEEVSHTSYELDGFNVHEFWVETPTDSASALDAKWEDRRSTREYKINLGPAKPVSFETEFGGFYVTQANEKPAFGLRKGVYTVNSKITLDLVTLFKGKDNVDLGGAATYHFLIGNGNYHNTKGIFGFPLRVDITVGFAGLDLTRVDSSKGGFIGIGLAIPTTKF